MTANEIVKALRWNGAEYKGNTMDDDDKALMVDAADLIEQQQAEIERLKAEVPKWISVEERLPDFHEEVLIYAIGKEDGFSPVVAISEIYVFRLLPFSNGTIEWRDPWDFFSKNYEVTHWMPLPNPPEDGNE